MNGQSLHHAMATLARPHDAAPLSVMRKLRRFRRNVRFVTAMLRRFSLNGMSRPERFGTYATP